VERVCAGEHLAGGQRQAHFDDLSTGVPVQFDARCRLGRLDGGRDADVIAGGGAVCGFPMTKKRYSIQN